MITLTVVPKKGHCCLCRSKRRHLFTLEIKTGPEFSIHEIDQAKTHSGCCLNCLSTLLTDTHTTVRRNPRFPLWVAETYGDEVMYGTGPSQKVSGILSGKP